MVSVESPVRMSGPGRWKLERRIGRIVSDLAVQRQAVLECWERRAQALERTGIFVIRRKHNDMIGDCVLGAAVTCQSRGDRCGGGGISLHLPGGRGVSSHRGWMFKSRMASNRTCGGGLADLMISANR
jgi:hypothetical protein